MNDTNKVYIKQIIKACPYIKGRGSKHGCTLLALSNDFSQYNLLLYFRFNTSTHITYDRNTFFST